jgi:hypothetical protein
MTDDAPALNGNASHLAWLKSRHEALTADRTKDVEVPGYDGRVVLRCAPVPWRVIGRTQTLANREDREGSALAAANADVVIGACREVLFRYDDGELRSIDPSGDTRRIDADLAALFGRDVKSAREALRCLIPNEVVVAVVAGEILTWTTDMDNEVAGELAGE